MLWHCKYSMETAMKTDERTGSSTNPPDPWDRIAEPARPVDLARRDFTRTGLAVSGVLLTLTSRSALGGNIVCRSPSGFLSANASVHGIPTKCSGLSPGFWGTHPGNWPTPYQAGTCGSTSSTNTTSPKKGGGSLNLNSCTTAAEWSGGTNFCNVFSCSGNGAIYSQYTMMQVVWLTGNQDPYQLGAHFVAAMLNLKSGYTPNLTEAVLLNIYNEWNRLGYFEPTAGVKWYGPDIVAYLQSTFS